MFRHRRMARFRSRVLDSAIVLAVILSWSAASSVASAETGPSDVTDLDELLSHQDYSPPAPPPPPPHPPSVSCTDDLGGIGSLDTTCQIVGDLNLTKDVYIAGKGNFVVLPSVKFHCPRGGCEIAVNITGNFSLGENASIVTGSFELVANNASFANGTAVNTTAMAGAPPAQTSGTPQGVDGAGGGHGGRGAGCLTEKDKKEGKTAADVWGGDTYSWQGLDQPCSYGSRGGTTSREADFGGDGGGRIKITVLVYLEVNGSILADGGDGGSNGGGGSGGSIYIKAQKM